MVHHCAVQGNGGERERALGLEGLFSGRLEDTGTFTSRQNALLEYHTLRIGGRMSLDVWATTTMDSPSAEPSVFSSSESVGAGVMSVGEVASSGGGKGGM